MFFNQLKKHRQFYILVSLFWIIGCAQVNPLVGGPKDTTAPSFDPELSSPKNGQLNFSGNEVQIKFSEYIKLNNANDNIIVTPQLKERPTVVAKNKKFSLTFNEELEENTTYTINFNRVIQDITEQNDSIFQFVFSTGAYIDSMSIRGTIKDGFTNKNLENYLVALYPTNHAIPFDSIPLQMKPTYIGQSNTSGDFEINYLKKAAYYVFVFNDENRNLKLDASENRGFSSTFPIELIDSMPKIEMRSFKEADDTLRRISTTFEFPGKLTLVFNQAPDFLRVTNNSGIQLVQEETEREDSLIYWMETVPVEQTEFYLEINNAKDTLKPLLKNTPKGGKPQVLLLENNIVSGKLLPKERLKITVSEPISFMDTSKVHFFNRDSVELKMPGYKIQNLRTLEFDSVGTEYFKVVIDTGAFKSIYKYENPTESSFFFESRPLTYFGTLVLNIDTTFITEVFIELLNDKQEVVATRPFAKSMRFENLAPVQHQVRMILDANGDGKWTSGSLQNGLQPEQVIYNTNPIDVKSQWEREVDWLIEKIE
ncbi:Ig-like domain-containing protein [Crocinitomix catalasitica]|uniref:Ig-like domain-containing protein n=1 Tax=Crocinitomix catalasitica TaxID=184607 RepID=UPI0004883BC1|nr:Ig-like domain-containing protein [Crocinitomix catalasitica]